MAVPVQFLGGREGTGQAQRQRVGVGIHDAAHEAREGSPGIAFVSQSFLHGGDVDPETVGTEPPQEVLLAPIATYSAPMPTPARSETAEIGAFGSATKTSRAASRIKPSLRAASARRPLNDSKVFSLLIDKLYMEQNIPFKYNGAEQFVPKEGVGCVGDE